MLEIISPLTPPSHVQQHHSCGDHVMPEWNFHPGNNLGLPLQHATAPTDQQGYQQGAPPTQQPLIDAEQYPLHNHRSPQQGGCDQFLFQFQSPLNQGLGCVDRRGSSHNHHHHHSGCIPNVPSDDLLLDPNLKCLRCGRQFRKGDIQAFRQHANDCHY